VKHLNRITLVGFVASEPMLQKLGDTHVMRLKLSVQDRSTRRLVAGKTPREIFHVAAFGQAAPTQHRGIRYGDRIFVDGSGHHVEYTDRKSIKRALFEVHAHILLRLSDTLVSDATAATEEAGSADEPPASEPSEVA